MDIDGQYVQSKYNYIIKYFGFIAKVVELGAFYLDISTYFLLKVV